MKKTIGILGVMAFSMAIFFNTTNENDLSDMSFDSLIKLNDANAEECTQNCNPTPGGGCWDAWGVCTSYSSWL